MHSLPAALAALGKGQVAGQLSNGAAVESHDSGVISGDGRCGVTAALIRPR